MATQPGMFHLNYKAKLDLEGIKSADRSGLFGPNTLGEYFIPVSAVWDAEKKVTRVGFDIENY